MNRLLFQAVFVSFCIAGSGVAHAQLDIQAIKARGLSVTRSQHLTLITDVRDHADVAEFNEVFEAAVQQWCEYFEIPPAAIGDWHLTGCVILDQHNKQKFVDAGLFPDDLPPFPAGFQRGSNIWLYLQDGDYYTRHLLIHEGTHAFMEKFLGGYGAPWYAEGIAELLGVHRWQDGQLTINHQISRREEVPFWGRVKLVRKDRDTGLGRSLDEVLAIKSGSFREVRSYGWAWAACQFFDRHPQFQKTFRKLPALASLSPQEFNRQFVEELKDQWPSARQHWQNLVDEIDYGYDVAQAQPVAVTDLSSDGTKSQFTLAANRGWQTTGIDVNAGDRIEVLAQGKYQIKRDGEAWPCDAGGVTIEYYLGRPLGRLIAAVRTADDNAPLKVIDVGTRGELECKTAGELYFRINESPTAWSDNEGSLTVTVALVTD